MKTHRSFHPSHPLEMSLQILFAAILFFGTALPLARADVYENYQANYFVGSGRTYLFDQFTPAQGTLTSTEVIFASWVDPYLDLRVPATALPGLYLATADYYWGIDLRPVNINAPTLGSADLAWHAEISCTNEGSGCDALAREPDGMGISWGKTFSFSTLEELSPFVGNGAFNVMLISDVYASVTAGPEGQALNYPNVFLDSDISFGSEVTVRYTFDPAVPVPEPETYAMLLAGLGLLGFFARRRKQNSA